MTGNSVEPRSIDGGRSMEWQGMNAEIDPDLERGYNIRQTYDDFEGYVAGLVARSAETRANADVTLDLAYDAGEQDSLDLFRCGVKDAPLHVFIHGGYWQRGSKSMYSFVCEPYLETGVDVAMLGYELCPTASMDGIVAKMRAALGWLWHHGREHGVNPDRLNLSGHSAGGHLTAMMLATEFDKLGSDLPRNLIKAAIPISGLYQLDPLRKTTIGEALQLDDASSRRNSPHFLRPVTDAPILVALGGGETDAFHWQTNAFIDAWQPVAAKLDYFSAPEANHFGAIEQFADASSEMFPDVAGLVALSFPVYSTLFGNRVA